MTDEQNAGVYGENTSEGEVQPGIREETVSAHPQPTGDAAVDSAGADAADEVRTRGAESIEGSEGSVAEDLDAVRRGAENDTGSGGMGREGTPHNENDAPQGEFTPPEDEPTTPG